MRSGRIRYTEETYDLLTHEGATHLISVQQSCNQAHLAYWQTPTIEYLSVPWVETISLGITRWHVKTTHLVCANAVQLFFIQL